MKKDNYKITIIIAAIPAAALVFAVFAVRQIDNVGKFALRNADTAAPTTKVPDYVPATTRADEARMDGVSSLIPRPQVVAHIIRIGGREIYYENKDDSSPSRELFVHKPMGQQALVENMLRHNPQGYDANYNRLLSPDSPPSAPFARSKPSDSVLLVPSRYRETRRHRTGRDVFPTSNQ